MRKKKKLLPLFFSSLGLCVLLSILVIFWSPEQSIGLLDFSVSIKLLFFALVFSAVSLLFSFLFSNIFRGFLAGTFVVLFLLLRLFGFTNLFYPILLIMLIILIDRLMAMRS